VLAKEGLGGAGHGNLRGSKNACSQGREASRGSTRLLRPEGDGLDLAGNGANRARLSRVALRVQARGWFSSAWCRAFSRWRDSLLAAADYSSRSMPLRYEGWGQYSSRGGRDRNGWREGVSVKVLRGPAAQVHDAGSASGPPGSGDRTAQNNDAHPGGRKEVESGSKEGY